MSFSWQNAADDDLYRACCQNFFFSYGSKPRLFFLNALLPVLCSLYGIVRTIDVDLIRLLSAFLCVRNFTEALPCGLEQP